MDALLDPWEPRDTLPGVRRPWLQGEKTTELDTLQDTMLADGPTADLATPTRTRIRST